MAEAARRKVIVIGGGVAGLAAATRLSAQGCIVTLLEQNSRLGGRTYSFVDRKTESVIDNGQHILMGCYTYTLQWLDVLGQISKLRIEDQIEIPFVEPGKPLFPLTLPNLISPFHLLSGILRFRNLNLWDRFSLVRAGLTIRRELFGPSGTVDAWLDGLGQTADSKKYFWNPICLAVMNENAATASAQVFTGAIRRMFFAGRDSSKIIIPRVGLSELLVEPAAALIRKNGGIIRLNAEVKNLHVEEDELTGVYLRNGEFLEADCCIAAVTPSALKNILEETIFEKHFYAAGQFKSFPIVSVYLWLGRNVDELFQGDFIGCIGTTIQWIFKKSASCIEVTISDAGRLRDCSRAELVRLVTRELNSLFPGLDRSMITHFQIIKERSATFSAEQEAARPDQETPINNFFIIGDWTRTGLPSTIESAVKSAYLAVEKIGLEQNPMIKEEICA